MQFQQNYSLKNYNTFGIEVYAQYFSAFSSFEELDILFSNYKSQTTNHKLLILGGGSNILFTKNYDGLVLKNDVTGVVTINEDNENVYLKTGAGENWNQFVMYCIENNLSGVENLSLIPGNVGASPMQNIGAYGVEIKDVFHSLDAFHLAEKKMYTFTSNDCEFNYRESIFKKRYKDEFVIMNVTFKLSKQPVFNISYGAIKQELEKMNIHNLSIKAISQAVIKIRSSKLPDPKVTGNAGSFFKNPEVDKQKYDFLKTNYAQIPGYLLDSGKIKVAAGWLIEQCGWKGFRRGDAGCHADQALVLVNYGHATGGEIYDLSEKIKQSVKQKFDIDLEREVNII